MFLPEPTPTTRAHILEAGKKEFLAKGFRDASLRNIVKEAGVKPTPDKEVFM